MMKRRILGLIMLVALIMVNSVMVLGAEGEDLGSWETKESMPIACTGFGTAEVDGKIYAVGGLNSNYEIINSVNQYDPDTNTWTVKAGMPTPRRDLGVVAVNGKIYAIGGHHTNYVATVEEYDPVTDTWTAKTDMPTARENLGVTEVNGKIYAIGGNGLATVEEYDTVTDTWTTKASMSTPRSFVAVEKANGKIYAIGGNGLATVEEYDPSTDVWTTKSNIPTERFGVGIEEVNGKIYVIGGKGGGTHLDTVEEYDPVTDTWNTKANMITARGGLSATKVNEMIYCIGGFSDSKVIMATVEVFKSSSSIFVNAPTNLTAIESSNSIVLNWNSVTDADSYTILRSTTSSAIDTVIASNITGTTYTDTDVIPGVTYYYVVRAVKSGVESADSNIASAMIEISNNRALLLIKLLDENDKEYDLAMSDVDTFMNWYFDRSAGQGPAYYTFTKDYNAGPYISRKEYISYDKIICIEVNEYTK